MIDAATFHPRADRFFPIGCLERAEPGRWPALELVADVVELEELLGGDAALLAESEILFPSAETEARLNTFAPLPDEVDALLTDRFLKIIGDIDQAAIFGKALAGAPLAMIRQQHDPHTHGVPGSLLAVGLNESLHAHSSTTSCQYRQQCGEHSPE